MVLTLGATYLIVSAVERGPFIRSLPGVAAGDIRHDHGEAGPGDVGAQEYILPDVIAPEEFQVELVILQAERFHLIHGELVDQDDRRFAERPIGGQSRQHLLGMLVPAADDDMILDLDCFQPPCPP